MPEDSLSGTVEFTKEGGLVSATLEPDLKAADPGEQTRNFQGGLLQAEFLGW